jgi:hypothetical protein
VRDIRIMVAFGNEDGGLFFLYFYLPGILGLIEVKLYKV